MKFSRKIISLTMVLMIILNLSIISSIPITAHEAILDVTYDACVIDENNSEGINEMWYALTLGNKQYHFPSETITITYCFAGNPDEWIPNGKSASVGVEIKNAYANSMKKWNNVYFYSYNSDGTITKNKLIEVVEITEGTPNIIISPATMNEMGDDMAGTVEYTEWGGVETVSNNHIHYSHWLMWVNIDAFCEETDYTRRYNVTSADTAWIKEQTGAHELGHVLGLFDLDADNLCGATGSGWHHHEALMGYGFPPSQRTLNISYRDIAGVAITRGFHTDNDHKWLNMGQQSDGKYKLVCSICNGVRHVTTEELIEYSYHTYGACNNEHDLPDGNMMAVASYGNQDYYKCKYCRYVAPFSEIVEQNYSKVCCSADYHRCVNTVNGLAYEFYEPHTLVDGVCTECTSHDYNDCVYLNQLSHQRVCACGETGATERHYVTGGNGINRFVPCAGCGYMLDMRDDIHEGIMSITQVSVNGSYIRSDGIVVLVDEDIEAYLAGTLQFYHPEDVPVTQ